MADTSNRYSLNGLNRQKKLSGLHARRPENTSQYFNVIALPIAPTFVSILSVDIINGGSYYSTDTKVIFPQPEHPQGIRATGEVCLGLTKSSFSIQNRGSNYTIGNIFYIREQISQDVIGVLVVSSTDSNGAILDFKFLQTGLLYSNKNYLVINSKNKSASIVIQDFYFSINYIKMTNFGSGYQTYSRTSGQAKSHQPIIYDARYEQSIYEYNGIIYAYSDGYGAVLNSNKNAQLLETTAKDNRSRYYFKTKYNTLSLCKDSTKITYDLINNFSLSDPTR